MAFTSLPRSITARAPLAQPERNRRRSKSIILLHSRQRLPFFAERSTPNSARTLLPQTRNQSVSDPLGVLLVSLQFVLECPVLQLCSHHKQKGSNGSRDQHPKRPLPQYRTPARSGSVFLQRRRTREDTAEAVVHTRILLWRPICRKRVNEDGKEIDENFLVMREFVVFNVEQITGLPQFRVGLPLAKQCKP